MRLPRWLTVPMNESITRLALAVAVLQMTGMLLILIWQAELIVYQRALIWDLFNALYHK